MAWVIATDFGLLVHLVHIFLRTPKERPTAIMLDDGGGSLLNIGSAT